MAALSYNLSLSFSKNSSLSPFPSQFVSPSHHLRSGNGFRVRNRNANRSFTIRSARESKAAVVTGNSWEKSILKNDIPVLVEFYASWCGPCRMVHRVIDDIAEEYDGRLRCFILNTDKDLKVAEDYEIKAVPVVLLFKNGQKRDCIVGTMPKEYYITAIEKVLAS